MSLVQFEIPEEIIISLKLSPTSLSDELRFFAALKLFELGRLSSGRAAQLSGLSRVEFLQRIGEYQVSPFILSEEQLARDVGNA